IEIRRTDRRPLIDVPVRPEVLDEIRAAVEAERVHLHLLRPEQVSELAFAAGRADDLTAEDEKLRDELARWVGGPRSEGTGLPDASIPVQPPHTAVPVRDFGRTGTLPTDQPAGRGDAAASYGVIFGEQDTPDGWLRAGEALSAAWLVATEHGVALLPFSAPVEVTVTRVVLWRLLAGLGHPYLVVRFGLPDPDHPGPPHTPRLDPGQTVEIVDGAGCRPQDACGSGWGWTGRRRPAPRWRGESARPAGWAARCDWYTSPNPGTGRRSSTTPPLP